VGPIKLIIQIPCFNEEETLPRTIADLPKQIDGVDEIGIQIIDDGSSDATTAVARRLGAIVITLGQHRGLASAFRAGLQAALLAGADIVVNTDADNQYVGQDIQVLVRPILAGHADVVVGDRQVFTIPDFSVVKKVLQKVGSAVVGLLSGVRIPDATSGFRAYNRDAAMRTLVFSNYTYTLETLIQAGRRGLRIVSIPIRTNRSVRPSRLVSSIPSYVARSIGTLVRIFVLYRPLSFFLTLALPFLLVGFGLVARFILYYFTTVGQTGHVQSLILAAISIILGMGLALLGLLGDISATNRVLTEEVLLQLTRLSLGTAEARRSSDPSAPTSSRND
jgi:glycosyltransferase involved in cell wall biosynthesis